MDAFAKDPTFVAMHLPPVPVHFVPVAGRNLKFKDANGKAAAGYYVPPASGAKAAVILVHEWWGLNDYIRKTAEELHEKTGYAVLAVDMYEGKVATTQDTAGRYMAAANANEARGRAIVKGAVRTLKAGGLGFKAAKIGSVGYCFGGGWSFTTAIEGGKDVNASVVYYGMPDTSPKSMAAIKAPVLFIHPRKDQWITDEVVTRFESAMKAAKLPYETHHYDTDHAFANPSNPKFDRGAAADAMSHELAWFKKYLG